MTPDGRLVQVEIFGQTYRLRADEDPEYVETLASYVDGRMREIARQTTAVDTLKVAVLTALNIADDHLRQQRQRDSAGAAERPTAEGTPQEAPRADLIDLASRITECNRILDEALGA